MVFPAILNSILRLWSHLSRQRKKQFLLLLVLMLLSASAEVVSLGSILPFLGALLAPDRIFNHPIVADKITLLGIQSANELVLPLTILFVISALIASALRLFFLWASTRVTFSTGADLSVEVYRRTLYQPYSVHVARNSSEVISSLTTKVGGAIMVLSQLLTLISSVVLIFAITFTLIIINPVVALIACLLFGVSYGVVSWYSRIRLELNSRLIADGRTKTIKVLQEGLGGIRDVLLNGAQLIYCHAYMKADRPLRRALRDNIFMGASPRYIMEALGMILIAVIAYGLSLEDGGIAAALPVLGALALGAQRLLPALQQAYGSWAGIVGNQASLIDTISLLDQPILIEYLQSESKSIQFKSEISFKSVYFRYSQGTPWVLNNINFNICKGARVGIIGETGGGKSTVMDLIMGLLVPTEGAIFLDGQKMTGGLIRAWQKTIAHVPQNIFLADSTFAENIAFGVPLDFIDFDRVIEAAKKAQISDLIENQPLGYLDFVGERGIRLSGGQRQRIGIARALYKKANVLIFDEATSALDNATERTVMGSIEELGDDFTIVLIAHRLTTLRQCSMILELGSGGVLAAGTYEQMIARHITK